MQISNRLDYDEGTDTFSSPKGINVTVPSPFDATDPWGVLSYQAPLALLDYKWKEWGYTYGENFLIVGYDWRYFSLIQVSTTTRMAMQYTNFLDTFRSVVEYTYSKVMMATTFLTRRMEMKKLQYMEFLKEALKFSTQC